MTSISHRDKDRDTLEHEVKYEILQSDVPNIMAALRNLVDKGVIIETFCCMGTDHYYGNSDRPTTFLRYRERPYFSDVDRWSHPELTFKEVFDNDTVVRTEINLPIRTNNLRLVSKFTASMGYTYNFSIVKTAFIYQCLDGTSISIYTVHESKAKNSKPRTFFEIETGLSTTIEDGTAVLDKWITLLWPYHGRERLNQSLFHLYKK